MSTMMQPMRWSDRDRYVGPFTFARGRAGDRGYALVLAAPDHEDGERGCYLRITVRGHTMIIALPPILRPWREKVYPQSWDAETIARLGRNWYWHTDRREFGASLNDGHLSVRYGRQADDSRVDRQWGCFLPWTQWRHVRHSVYGLAGEHVATEPTTPNLAPPERMAAWRVWREQVEAAPTQTFAFTDFDGEPLTARTRIEEREWRFGTGAFRWLSWFRRPRVARSLDIDFSRETGRRKGSWKGGTVGHSIDMRPGELHEAAFRRYCAAHEMTFCGTPTPPEAARG